MPPSFLITQCLQNDFVQPIGKNDPLPNLLHVGWEEARRLMGEHPAEGPVARMMAWAHAQPADRLQLIHIRDWHRHDDPEQLEHLKQFGPHCLVDTAGAAFAFPSPLQARPATNVDASGLNDFVGTPLARLLAPLTTLGDHARVGIVGVWTDAKVSYLAYELRTRWPSCQVAVCSALCASSSRAAHFLALEQMQKLLDVKIFDSIGEFTQFLVEGTALPLEKRIENVSEHHPCLKVDAELSVTDRQLLRWLFRDCKEVALRSLSGGFSGNLVLESDSHDMLGQRQAPHVIKVGPSADIGRERTAFERIEAVLGNNAPRIADFADHDERGAIKYRYASMGPGHASTFQKLYCNGLSAARTKSLLSEVFEEQLGRLYAAGTIEKVNLVEYYMFTPAWAGRVREKVRALAEPGPDGDLLLPGGMRTPDVSLFYERDLPSMLGSVGSACFSYVHGDLNGANIIIDSHHNVWLIDFFHAHRGHVLKDLLKFENDVLYIMTPVNSESEFVEACRFTDALLKRGGRGKWAGSPAFQRAWQTVGLLRRCGARLTRGADDPRQWWIGLLRYAVHTLSFFESNDWQKRWALYTAGRLADALRP
jgi:nicotinamidase-related amidase